jgi:hypothetical protein
MEVDMGKAAVTKRVLDQIEAHHAQLSPDTKAWLEQFLDAREK